MTAHTLEVLTFIIACVGVSVTICAVHVAKQAIDSGQKIAKADLYLRFDERLRDFQDVNVALRPDGTWDESGPSTDVEWAQVEAYMGFFERLQVLVDDGIVAKKDLKAFYEYRYTNILANRLIVNEKLSEEEVGLWDNFLKFGETLTGGKGQEEVCKLLELYDGYCDDNYIRGSKGLS